MEPKLRIILLVTFFVLLTNIAFASGVIQVLGKSNTDEAIVKVRIPQFNDVWNDVYNDVYKSSIYRIWGVQINVNTKRDFGNGYAPLTVLNDELKKTYH